MTLGIVLLYFPRRGLFFMSKVPLYSRNLCTSNFTRRGLFLINEVPLYSRHPCTSDCTRRPCRSNLTSIQRRLLGSLQSSDRPPHVNLTIKYGQIGPAPAPSAPRPVPFSGETPRDWSVWGQYMGLVPRPPLTLRSRGVVSPQTVVTPATRHQAASGALQGYLAHKKTPTPLARTPRGL